MGADTRRQVPRTDAVLADERLVAATRRLGKAIVKGAVIAAQHRAVVGRVEQGRCLLDLRGLPPERDDDLRAAVLAAAPREQAGRGRSPCT